MKKELVYAFCGLLVGLIVGSGVALFLCQKNESASHTMQVSSSAKDGDEFDKSFLADMIVHHQGGVDMAKLANTKAKHDEIKKLATDIVTQQSKEIDIMQTWQGEWGYKTVPTMQNVTP